MAIKQITLQAWSDNSEIPPQIINQGDILSRTVIFTLLDSGGTPIKLTQSAVRVHFSKPDGKVCYLTASIVNAAAGTVTVTLDSQCTAVSGTVKSIVQVTNPDGENLFIVGPAFTVGAINVEGSILSANEFTTLTDALKEVQSIANEITALEDALQQVKSIANKADKSTKINGHPLTGSFDISADETGAVPKTRTLAGLPLSADITLAQFCNFIYPIGSIYMSVSSANPGTLFGGTWAAWGMGRVPLGCGLNEANTYNGDGTNLSAGMYNQGSSEVKGGEYRECLTVKEMPPHSHQEVIHGSDGTDNPGPDYGVADIHTVLGGQADSVDFTKSTGGNFSHNNMPPYVTCYMWKRTA